MGCGFHFARDKGERHFLAAAFVAFVESQVGILQDEVAFLVARHEVFIFLEWAFHCDSDETPQLIILYVILVTLRQL